MSKAPGHVSGTVDIVDDIATIRLTRSSEVILARVLGVVVEVDGREAIYLDRLVHRPEHASFCGYEPDGCVSTILRAPRE
ncbi:hypothetical protein JN531_016580 (plasmid) [Flagellatimonas centrodinii]|uniref:hypothetical protein n=1 Tax=Flagellatimonas centrodinii TaxID=2806210 RepID=UPI001FFA3F86|nr:hypothetical protein [Flagellatimonas centrodinii]ULQ48393.1 hypothetical protein JN531_016580 [Flagellatimonas centrodinii]